MIALSPSLSPSFLLTFAVRALEICVLPPWTSSLPFQVRFGIQEPGQAKSKKKTDFKPEIYSAGPSGAVTLGRQYTHFSGYSGQLWQQLIKAHKPRRQGQRHRLAINRCHMVRQAAIWTSIEHRARWNCVKLAKVTLCAIRVPTQAGWELISAFKVAKSVVGLDSWVGPGPNQPLAIEWQTLL